MKRIILFTLLYLGITATYAQDRMPSPVEIREAIAADIKSLNVAPEPVANVSNEFVISGKDSIPVRIYSPNKKVLPVIYLIHGGAMVAGDLDTHDNICRYLANHAEATVIAVHYRRPPEHKFPAAFNDSYAVLKWISNDMKKFKNNNKLILLGDSAGGQLAAAVALANATEKKPIAIAAQVLINPALDVSKESATYAAYPFMVEWYINKTDDPKDNRLSPLQAASVKGVPPAIIVVCEKDELRSEGEAYHKKLTDAGIASKLYMQPNAGHLGGYWCAASDKAKPSMDFVVTELKRVLKK